MIRVINKAIFGGVFLSLTLLSIENIQSQTTQEDNKPITVKNADKLVADKVKMDNEHLVVDSMLMQIGLEAEEEMFPSDELYDGQWNNDFVKAYANVTVPDTYTIDISEFIMPFEGKVTSKYGKRRRRFHYGTDIKLQVGDTVRSAFDGKVRIMKFERRGYGNFVVLRHSNGLETVYGHLSKFLVEEGENVEAGQAIGLGGNTGRSTGSHLHLEFRFLGRAINPEEIIDFAQFCTKDEVYVYKKGKSELPNNSKYIATGDEKIKYYRIKEGDTLGAIARKTRTSVDKLCKLNKMKPTTILRIGKSIRLS
jgi:murein DD-endopeptidase MepM/ murein hydrolase activator NlpD